MKYKITKEFENDFFKRKDLEVEIAHPGEPTPKSDDLRAELAKKYGVDASQVKLDYILTIRGAGMSSARAKILREKPVVKEEPKEVEKSEA